METIGKHLNKLLNKVKVKTRDRRRAKPSYFNRFLKLGIILFYFPKVKNLIEARFVLKGLSNLESFSNTNAYFLLNKRKCIGEFTKSLNIHFCSYLNTSAAATQSPAALQSPRVNVLLKSPVNNSEL